VAIGGPLEAFAPRAALGEPANAHGYGELVDKGDLLLPRRFRYRIISRQGDVMSDGNPTPSRFDGMVAFRGGDAETILMRNHENKRRLSMAGSFAPANEVDVIVPDELRYDPNPLWNGGVVRLVVDDRRVEDSRAVLGGTTHNCAGGRTPWGSWITCEELFQPPPSPAGFTTRRHGYIFEVDAGKETPRPPCRLRRPAASSTRPLPGSTAPFTKPKIVRTRPSIGTFPTHAPRPVVISPPPTRERCRLWWCLASPP
jgi:hypothetical protein